MSTRPPSRPRSVDENARRVAELYKAERLAGLSPVPTGPYAAYLLMGLLGAAIEAPGMADSELVHESACNSLARLRQAMGRSTWAGVYAELDDLNAAAVQAGAAPGDAPGDRYVDLIGGLIDAERTGGKFTYPTGPYATFVMCGLLQMVVRRPDMAEHADTVEQLVRLFQRSFAPEYAALIEQGFDPALDVDADGRYALGGGAFVRGEVPEDAVPDEGEPGPPGVDALALLGEVLDLPELVRATEGDPEAIASVLHALQGYDGDEATLAMVVQALWAQMPCPNCPRCGHPPTLALSHLQAVCGNDDCDTMFWNPSKATEQHVTRMVNLETGEQWDVPPPGSEVVEDQRDDQHDR